MKIKFLGGAGEVTGSAHLIKTSHGTVLRDCGMFQGRRADAHTKSLSLFSRAGQIDAVIISHAHVDHCGNLPTIVRQGYNGPVYATPATADLLPIMWQDSLHIQQADQRYLLKTGKSLSQIPEQLYGEAAVEKAISLIRRHEYLTPVALLPGIEAEHIEAGHILGSSLSKITVTEQGRTTKLGFALDLGRKGLPILKDPGIFKDIDTLVIESTYGGRIHEPVEDLEERLAAILSRTFARGGKVIIPAFALGRVQEITYSLKRIFDSGRVRPVPVYVDSPLGDKISGVMRRHLELFDEESLAIGTTFLSADFIHYTTAKDDSQKLNDIHEPCIIIASSGMCEAGRVLHHLMHNLGNPANTILFVGFLAEHTLGRKILDGTSPVRIFDGYFPVHAEVAKLNAFSAHAGQNELLDFIKACLPLKHLILVHGEASQLNALAALAQTVTDAQIHIPSLDEEIVL